MQWDQMDEIDCTVAGRGDGESRSKLPIFGTVEVVPRMLAAGKKLWLDCNLFLKSKNINMFNLGYLQKYLNILLEFFCMQERYPRSFQTQKSQ